MKDRSTNDVKPAERKRAYDERLDMPDAEFEAMRRLEQEREKRNEYLKIVLPEDV